MNEKQILQHLIDIYNDNNIYPDGVKILTELHELIKKLKKGDS